MRLYFILLALSLSNCSYSQKEFEGEIVYGLETIKKDSSFDEYNLRAAGAAKTICIYKRGSFINRPDAGTLEYYYFKQVDNKVYSKYKDLDTLFYEPGDRLLASQDSLYTTNIEYNTDTILGYICNRFVLKSAKLTLTLIFSPRLYVNPIWFKHTKFSYYDIIYLQTHSLFLKSIAEFDRFISILAAERIQMRKVDDKEFPDISRLPKAL